MAFADAVFDGQAALDDVRGVRIDDPPELSRCLLARATIPVVMLDFATILELVHPDVLVDARMRKRARPEIQRELASLTVGLGPGFVAGVTTDLVVETSWEALGHVIAIGSPLALAGEPRPIAGYGRERYVYAPISGVFRTTFHIGDRVKAGEVLARIGTPLLAAPLAGAIRGLTRDAVTVSIGTKIIEVDPRDQAITSGIGERPARIADGVARAIRMWENAR
jgi:xanthine dehydrogenase accessory factor